MNYALLVVCLFAFTSVHAAAECASDLKPSDSYKELSSALKCMNNKIQVIEQKLGNTQGAVRVSSNEPVEIKGCVATSSLPNSSSFYLHPGAKFCRDDGFVWLRISPEQVAPDRGNYVELQFPANGQRVTCYLNSASCAARDEPGDQKFTLTVERGSSPQGKSVWVGVFQRLTN